MTFGIFDIVKNINEKGEGLLDPDTIKSEYNSFVINRALSNVKSTLFFSNEMNRLWGLDKDMQYAFYYYGITKKKRFGKWNKLQDDKETINAIQEYFNYSYHRAKEAVSLLTEDQINIIKKAIDRGGKK
jgi:hypothetical protein